MNDDEKKTYNEETDKKVTAIFNKQQADNAKARIRQLTGRNYPSLEAELTKLSVAALIDLSRVITDVQYEITRAKNQAIHQPWRR